MNMGLSRKIGTALIIAFIASILYASLFSYLLYERLYVSKMEQEMLETGERLGASYEGGTVNDDLIAEINWFGSKSQFEVFAVKNPRELSMCLPFEIDYDALITGDDRQALLKGNPVYKKGFEERLDRNVISVIVPLLDAKRLEGVIYLYYPLDNVSDMILHYSLYWIAGALVFLMAAWFFGRKWLKVTLKPVREMKEAAKALASGDLSVRVAGYPDDEIGRLADTFNLMAGSLQQEDKRKKEFLANVSHELRTPLSYMKGYMHAIEAELGTSEDRKKYEHIIIRETLRMERLIDDLLDLAKFESKEFSLNKAPLSLAQTIEETVDQVMGRLGEKKIKLHTSFDYSLIANADEQRLTQIVLNILDNAIRYTPEEGAISVRLYQEKDGAVIEVSDNGAGVPDEDLAKLTERFYRVHKARTRKEGGTGLGLPIVDTLVKLHGGSLMFQSELGKGTTVKITLPKLS